MRQPNILLSKFYNSLFVHFFYNGAFCCVFIGVLWYYKPIAFAESLKELNIERLIPSKYLCKPDPKEIYKMNSRLELKDEPERGSRLPTSFPGSLIFRLGGKMRDPGNEVARLPESSGEAARRESVRESSPDSSPPDRFVRLWLKAEPARRLFKDINKQINMKQLMAYVQFYFWTLSILVSSLWGLVRCLISFSTWERESLRQKRC